MEQLALRYGNYRYGMVYLLEIRTMLLQLNPTIPVVRVSDKMEGYAFVMIDLSQEHDLLFVCGMDNGEIWTLTNREIRLCKNISLDRKDINYGKD